MQTYEKENAIVTACIGSFKKIFSRFIDAEDLLLKENLTGDEAGEALPGHRSTCADPEGGTGVRTPLKNHKNIGFLSNIGPDPL